MLSLFAQLGPDADAVGEAVPDGLTVSDWIVAAVVFVGALVLAAVLRKLLGRTVGRRAPSSAKFVGRVVTLFVGVAGFVYALSSIGVQVGLFVGALGIGGIALAFAFQDLLENFMAGVILQLKRPFRPGNIVEIGEARHLGTVRDVDSRTVIVDTFAGDRIVVPAAEVLKSPIINWTSNGRRRLEVPVGIAYEADPQVAIDAITTRLDAIDEVLPQPAPRVLLSGFGESSVDLVAYVWHDAYADIFFVQHRVVQEIKRALADAGIRIPLPQRVVTFSSDGRVGELHVRDGWAADGRR